MMTTTQLSLTQSLSTGIHELEQSIHDLLPVSLTPRPVRQASVIPDVERDEQRLLESLRQRDEAAFGSLVEQYHTRLLRLAKAYVSSEAIAEEVVQETWMGVLEGIDRFEGRSSIKTWIYRILTNRAKTRGQRESRYVSFSEATPPGDGEEDLGLEPERFHASGPLAGHWALPPTTWDERTPERLLLSKEGMDLVEKAINALPANQRQVIILRDVEGVDSEDVCQLLSVTQSNQRVLLHRARSKVRVMLNTYLQEAAPQGVS